jgi:hypothetical protein
MANDGRVSSALLQVEYTAAAQGILSTLHAMVEYTDVPTPGGASAVFLLVEYPATITPMPLAGTFSAAADAWTGGLAIVTDFAGAWSGAADGWSGELGFVLQLEGTWSGVATDWGADLVMVANLSSESWTGVATAWVGDLDLVVAPFPRPRGGFIRIIAEIRGIVVPRERRYIRIAADDREMVVPAKPINSVS